MTQWYPLCINGNTAFLLRAISLSTRHCSSLSRLTWILIILLTWWAPPRNQKWPHYVKLKFIIVQMRDLDYYSKSQRLKKSDLASLLSIAEEGGQLTPVERACPCHFLCVRYVSWGSYVPLPRGPDHSEDARPPFHRHARAGARLLLARGWTQRDLSRQRGKGRHPVCSLPRWTSHRRRVCFICLWRTCSVRLEETQGNLGEKIYRAF